MSNNANAGIAYITIDGVSYSIAGDASYTLSTVTREALMGPDGFHGYKEMPAPGKISIKFRNGSAVDVNLLNSIVNSTVVLEMNNGKTAIGRNMFRDGEPIEVETEDGTGTLNLTGPSVTESGVSTS
jgi:hypothetical protein